MPPNFKRILGSRLRRLASQGKLEKVSQLKSGVSLESLALNKSFLSICVDFCLPFLCVWFFDNATIHTTDAELLQDE